MAPGPEGPSGRGQSPRGSGITRTRPQPSKAKHPGAPHVYEEDRKSEPSNNSVPRDTLAEAEAQALTQALVHDLSSVNMGEKAQKGEQIRSKRGLTSKIGQDLDLGDRFFSLSDQSSWTSDEAIESREGSSQAWKTSWSEADSETTKPGEDEDEKSECGKGSDQPESFKAASVKKKKMKKRISKALQWDYSSAPELGGLGSLGDSLADTTRTSLEMIHQSILEHLEETKAESSRT
ncbi:hypothetical protein NDU88_006098 [Pleurodeles waltl]|uniref:Uncharacterized protein n=1 Tax=Pleurodeles waltl TaxID=8319 RepID=A0AAV7TDA6_PLEWA|nr:hypothetical protein NDU88_006098 [Pleurodeles waltl]